MPGGRAKGDMSLDALVFFLFLVFLAGSKLATLPLTVIMLEPCDGPVSSSESFSSSFSAAGCA